MENAKKFDDAARATSAILELNNEQAASLRRQAMQLGSTTKFDAVQVAEAQKALAGRISDPEIIKRLVDVGAEWGQAMGTDLPTAVKALESIIFSTGQAVETADEATKVARRQSAIMLKTAKLGGITDAGELMEAFKFGGTAGHVAGLSNPAMGALIALMHRAGISGPETGVAVRSISGSLLSPTKNALMAMNALGINYASYVKEGGGLTAENLNFALKRQLGKEIGSAQMERIRAILDNPDVVASQEEFTKGVTEALGGSELRPQDARVLSKAAGAFWKAAIAKVDTDRLLRDIIAAGPSAAQANALFTKQQGGRFESAAQYGLGEYLKYVKAINEVPDTFPAQIASERMAGIAGASARLQGALTNLGLSFERANEVWLIPSINKATDFVNALSGMGDTAKLSASALVGLAGAAAALKTALAGINLVKYLTAAPAGAAVAGGAAGGGLISSVVSAAPSFALGVGAPAAAFGLGTTYATPAGEKTEEKDRQQLLGADPRAPWASPWNRALPQRVETQLTGQANLDVHMRVELDPGLIAREVQKTTTNDVGVTMAPGAP